MNLLNIILILFSSYIITTFLDKKYSFFKLSGFLLFYYFLILLFANLSGKFLKFKNSKTIGSIVGFIVSIILWFNFGYYAKL